MELKQVMERQDWQAMACYLKERYDIEIDVGFFQKHFGKKLETAGDYTWSDGSWDLWLRNRIGELGAWSAPGGEISPIHVECVMHVFFLALEETPEMLYRLSLEKYRMEPKEARSKIGGTLEVIHPIDRVAHRVAPESKKE